MSPVRSRLPAPIHPVERKKGPRMEPLPFGRGVPPAAESSVARLLRLQIARDRKTGRDGQALDLPAFFGDHEVDRKLSGGLPPDRRVVQDESGSVRVHRVRPGQRHGKDEAVEAGRRRTLTRLNSVAGYLPDLRE